MRNQSVGHDLENDPNAPPAPVVCGVYMLFLRHALIYVGRSKDCYRRIDSHRSNGRAFDYALVSSCPEWDATWIEKELIRTLAAEQNRAGRERGPSPTIMAPRVIVREQPIAPPHPLQVYNVGQAINYVKGFGLHAEFKAALASGELSMIYKDAANTGRGAPKIITHGELTAWCERRQQARFPARGLT